ncbi:MAG: hypothetical protein HY711_02845 [Candidatus Melainabacteria bacterium]|nr:hypothetical protein [Candidatus Melainabacteria bacterium]
MATGSFAGELPLLSSQQEHKLEPQNPVFDASKSILQGGIEEQVLWGRSGALQEQQALDNLWRKYYDEGWQNNLKGNVAEAWKNFSLALEIAQQFAQADSRRTMTLSGLAAVYTANKQYAEAQQIMAKLGYTQGADTLQAQHARNGVANVPLSANIQESRFRMRAERLNSVIPGRRFLGIGRRPCACEYWHKSVPIQVQDSSGIKLPSIFGSNVNAN